MPRWTGALALAVIGCASQAPTSERIGASEERIIKGTPSTSDQDDVVLIAWNLLDKDEQVCSGELVAKNLVLTAHHCVGDLDERTNVVTLKAPSALRIYIGADAPRHIAAGTSAAKGKQILTVDDSQLQPDLAFIVLDRQVDAPIAPIRLNGGAKAKENLTIVGFGITEAGYLPSRRMQRTGVSVLEVGPGMTDDGDMLAKGEFVFGEAACSGDSGGPAFSASSKAVVGVASRVGNGTQPTDQDPAAFCIGTGTEDVYTALSASTDLVKRAFTAAGATMYLEGQSAPPSTTGDGTDSSDPSASSADGGAEPDTKTSESIPNAGCNASPRAPAPLGAIGIALAGLAFVRRRRR
ncbi:MAG TPA: trypsin-like serine protease [Labilithrix sp.]